MITCVLLACSLAVQAPTRTAAERPPRIELLDDTVELERALAARSAPREVPVHVAAYAMPDADPARTTVVVVAEIDEGQQAAGLASIAYALTDGGGKRQAYGFRRVELRTIRSGRLVFSGSVTVPPGEYRLRVAAVRNLRTGAADAVVAARPKSAGPLRFGDVLIGETAGADVTASLGVERSVRGNRLVATLPIGFDRDLPPDLNVTLDVAKDEAGPAIVSAPAPILAGDGSARRAQAEVDVRVLPPGDYTARFVVSAGGAAVATIAAPVRIDRGAADGAPAPRPGASAAPVLGTRFQAQDVLESAVVGPFLDELAARAAAASRPAIDLARAGRYVEASSSLPASGPNDPSAPFLLGLSLYSQGQLQAASEAFRGALRASPDFLVGAFYIGACYAAGGRDQQAVNAWQTSLVSLEPFPVVYRLLGEALTRLGQPDRAAAILDEAATRWPDDPAMTARLAKAALDARRYDRALEHVEAGLARRPADTDLLLVGMQAIFERVTLSVEAPPADSVARLKRYQDAYVKAGGPQRSLVAEWVAAVEKKASSGRIPG
jgi:tetratricopeptide (TPR) repeat protein